MLNGLLARSALARRHRQSAEAQADLPHRSPRNENCLMKAQCLLDLPAQAAARSRRSRC